MALTQTNRTGRTYDELVEAARKLIPALAPTWTDHNPSDPGIALIELFAWLTELALYRLERIPLANYERFLGLLKGDPAWCLPLDANADETRRAEALATEIRATVLGLRTPYQMITAADTTTLLLDEWPQTPLAELLASLFVPLHQPDATAWGGGTQGTSVAQVTMGKILAACGLRSDLPIGELDQNGAQCLDKPLQAFQVRPYLRHNFFPTADGAVTGDAAVTGDTAARQAILTAIGIEAKTIKRVEYVPEQDLERRLRDKTRADQASAPGHVSVIVLVDKQRPDHPLNDLYQRYAPSDGLRAALWAFLDQRRLVTTRHHLTPPDFLTVTVTATLQRRADVFQGAVEIAAKAQLASFFDPVTGGAHRRGWPLGRAVYPSEVYQVLRHTPGIDDVTAVTVRPEQLQPQQLVAINPDLRWAAGG